MNAARRRRPSRNGGPERWLAGAALLVPLAVVFFAFAQLPALGLASPASVAVSDAQGRIPSKRPVASADLAPPPTLAPPTPSPKPTEAPISLAPAATPTPQKAGSYVVQPGDELKAIAADYNVSIWKIIAVNNIPDPDSLKVGQELRIPSE